MLKAKPSQKKVDVKVATHSVACHSMTVFLNTPVEPMHLLKNIGERIVQFISGKTDTVKARMEEKELNRFRSTWVRTIRKGGKDILSIPDAPFSLKQQEKDVANTRALNIVAPAGCDWTPKQLFGKCTSQLKSNEWRHILSSGILKFCIRGLLGCNQRSTLIELCDVVQLLCAHSVNMKELDSLEYRVHRVLSLLERDFPVTIHVISLHLLHHLPMYIRRFGPVYGYWMYPMERFNSWIARRVLNHRYPESNVMETYRVYEFAFFLQTSGRLPVGATTDIGGDTVCNDDCVECVTSTGIDSTMSYDTVSKSHGSEAVLEPHVMEELHLYYQRTCTTYNQIISSYNQEKEGNNSTSKKSFPPLSEWVPANGLPLSDVELNSREGPSNKITRYKVFAIKDKYYRTVKYGTELGEQSNNLRVSSYVHLVPHTDCIMVFGRIKYIFSHEFIGHVHILAYVHWYDTSTIDKETGLKSISLTSTNKSQPNVVSLHYLSRPLLHAVDENNPSKLWILNS